MSLSQRLHQFFTQHFAKPVAPSEVAALYARCVEQARQPSFYAQLGVPDTIDGRFDLLLLHVFMVMFRLKDDMATKQQLFDLMFADMDRSLREMGVGDMSISRKIKPMISAFYGRGNAYQTAIAGNDEALADTLTRNLYGKTPADPAHVAQIVAYVRRVMAELGTQSVGDIAAGKIVFPNFVAG